MNLPSYLILSSAHILPQLVKSHERLHLIVLDSIYVAILYIGGQAVSVSGANCHVEREIQASAYNLVPDTPTYLIRPSNWQHGTCRAGNFLRYIPTYPPAPCEDKSTLGFDYIPDEKRYSLEEGGVIGL